MHSSQSYYDVLGVPEAASPDDIDRAYEAFWTYPVGREETENGELELAYEVLSDPTSRREYDTLDEHGDGVAAAYAEADALLHREEPDPEAAIQKLERALRLGPQVSLLHARLGEVYLLDERPDAALEQVDRALELHGGHRRYRRKRGNALAALGRPAEAEAAYRELWDDPETNNHLLVSDFADVLSEQERPEEAYAVLDEAIEQNDSLVFFDLLTYHQKLAIAVEWADGETLERTLQILDERARREAERAYVEFVVVSIACELMESEQWSHALQFAATADDLGDDSYEIEEALRTLQDAASEAPSVHSEQKAMTAYGTLLSRIATVTSSVGAVFPGGEMDEEEVQEELDTMNEEFEILKKEMEEIDPPPGEDDPDPSDDVPDDADLHDMLKELADEVGKWDEEFEETSESTERNVPLRDEDDGMDDEASAVSSGPNDERAPAENEVILVEYGGRERVRCPHCAEAFHVGTEPYGSTVACSHCGRRIQLGSRGDCFVATAVYGDPAHPDVRALRRFRDTTLRSTALGRLFIAGYNRYGPGAAGSLRGHRLLKRGVRWALSRAVERWL